MMMIRNVRCAFLGFLSQPVALAVFSMLLAFNQASAEDVLGFDDLPDEFGSSIPDGYGGFDWSNMNYINSASVIVVPNSGFDNGNVSPTYVAYNGNGLPAGVSLLDGTFNFHGAYLTAGWNDGLTITITGLLDGSLLYSDNVVVDPTSPTWFDFNYLGIDELTFSSSGGTHHPGLGGAGGTQFVMDNFTTSIPEPSTMVLSVGAVLLGVMCLMRRRSWRPFCGR